MRRIFALLLVLPLIAAPLSGFAEETPNKTEEDYLKRSDRAEKWFFEDLPRHIGNDFKETFYNPWHLLALAGGVGVIAGVHEVDPEIQEAFHPEDPLGGAADVFNVMGNSLVLGGATLTAFIISKLVNAPKAALTAGTMLEALSITMALTFALKFATQRERPDGSDSHSFPSAHASGAFALAAVTEVFYGPLYGIPSYVLASMIALSRIDANKHVATDTLAGALLGTLIGLGTAKFHKKEFPNFFLVPTAGESSAGLSLVHIF
jgi:membrane-associated phospholipid phosphatase